MTLGPAVRHPPMVIAARPKEKDGSPIACLCTPERYDPLELVA